MKTDYVKRTQKDYTLTLKLQLVQSIENRAKLIRSSQDVWDSRGISCTKMVGKIW